MISRKSLAYSSMIRIASSKREGLGSFASLCSSGFVMTPKGPGRQGDGR
ncbi:hypothetical protein V1289_009869 [Bradyrhizobium sp. AZCC 2289]